MNLKYLFACLVLFTSTCFSQETTSTKVFEQTALLNKIAFNNPKYDQPKFSCGFLLKYNNDTFAVTAKHILQIVKPDEMKSLSFGNILSPLFVSPRTTLQTTLRKFSKLNQLCNIRVCK